MDFDKATLEKLKCEIKSDLVKDPLNERLMCKLASIEQEMRNPEEALRILRRAVEVSCTVISLNNLGCFYLHEGVPYKKHWMYAEDKAIDILEEAIGLNPVSHFPFSALGEAYLKKDRYKEAATILEKAISIKETVISTYNLGVALFYMHEYEKASVCFLKAYRLRNIDDSENVADCSYQAYLNYALCMAKLGRKQQAEEVAEYLLNTEEETVDLMDITELYYYCENYKKAAELFPVAFKTFQVSPDLFGMYEFTLMHLNMQDEADAFYEKSINYYEEWIDELENDPEINPMSGEDDRDATIGEFKEYIEQFGELYRRIKNGEKPVYKHLLSIIKDCYMFGCIRHNSLNYGEA